MTQRGVPVFEGDPPAFPRDSSPAVRSPARCCRASTTVPRCPVVRASLLCLAWPSFVVVDVTINQSLELCLRSLQSSKQLATRALAIELHRRPREWMEQDR